MNIDRKTNEELIEIGTRFSDGHFTLMKFTTNWRASFSTPNDRDEIQQMASAPTERLAVLRAFYMLMADIASEELDKEDQERSLSTSLGKKLNEASL